MKRVSVLLLAALLLAALPAAWAQVPRLLSYQGVLTDTLGSPKPDGLYTLTFRLYATESGGSALWTEQKTLQVKGGLFAAMLGDQVLFPATLKFNAPYWLSIQIAALPELAPRMMLGATGYSLHAVMSDTAVYALSGSHPPSADSAGVAGKAYGIVIPMYAGTNSSSFGLEIDNIAGTGDGIRGYSGSTAYNYAGVYAVCNGGTVGGNGGPGVYGTSQYGYGGYFNSDKYRGLYAKGGPSWYAGYFVDPSGSTSPGLYVDGTLVVTGAKSGYKVDFAQNDGPEPLEPGDLVAITGYSSPIVGERIPIVKVSKARTAESSAVAGVVDEHYIITTPLPAREPAKFDPMKKDQAVQSNDAAMIAAAHGAEYLPRPAPRDASKPNGTSIGAGEYLSMVTLGAFLTVKVDASFGAIQPGDLLVSSPNPGYAMRAASPKTGTVVGKALGSLASGTGTVPVLVTLH